MDIFKNISLFFTVQSRKLQGDSFKKKLRVNKTESHLEKCAEVRSQGPVVLPKYPCGFDYFWMSLG